MVFAPAVCLGASAAWSVLITRRGFVGLLLIGLGVNGVRTGSVLGRIGSVERANNPAWFWFRVALYLGLGTLALCYVWQ